MNPFFSTPSLILAGSMLGLTMGITLLVHGTMTKTRMGHWFGTALLLVSFGIISFLFDGRLPALVQQLISTVPLLAGFMVYEFGFSHIFRRPLRPAVPLIALSLSIPLLAAGTLIWDSFIFRTVAVNSILVFYLIRVSLLCFAQARVLPKTAVRLFGFLNLMLALAPPISLAFILADSQTITVSNHGFINSFYFFMFYLWMFVLVGGYFEFRGLDNRQEDKTQRDAEELLLDNQRFLNRVISHDLNGPLSSLHNLLVELRDLLRAGQIPESQFVDVMVDVSRSSNRLLQNVSDLGKYQLHRALPRPRETLLAPLLWSSIESMEVEAQLRNIEIIQEFQEDLLVLADQQGLQAVVRNLLEFFIDRSPKNSFILLQAVRSRDDKTLINIRIKDQGDALAPDFISDLAEYLNRRHNLYSKQENASSIGLMVMLTVCRELNWDLIFSNLDNNEGVQAELRIPASGSRQSGMIDPEV